ncbi:MAG: DUF2304 domain-containing protein [Desulfobacteraceae bacterium]|nr:DUF2304 domain-containing protein [Desulfobacteraceae bacterium]
MGLKIKVISFAIGAIFFLFIVLAIKRNNLPPLSALLWVVISLFLLSIPLLEPVYKWLSVAIVGIDDARHIIYIGVIGFLMVCVFAQGLTISRLSDKVQNLISLTAILEQQSRDEQSAERMARGAKGRED